MLGGGQFDFLRNGTLVYLAGNPSFDAKRKLVWIDAAGKTQPFFAAPDRFSSPALSPDGKRLAVSIGITEGSELSVYDLERKIPTKLPTAGYVLMGPVWAPGGKHLVYVAGIDPNSNNGVMWIRADGGGEPQRLTRDDTHRGQVAATVSPDGRFVLFGTPGRSAQSLTIDTTNPDHPKAGATELASIRPPPWEGPAARCDAPPPCGEPHPARPESGIRGYPDLPAIILKGQAH
jgi:serine/threonine-protein kinase